MGRKKYMRFLAILGGMISVGSANPNSPQVQQIEGTVHNLSVTGPGVARSTEIQEICRTCHLTHQGSNAGLLYNKPDTQAQFTLYDSPTLDALTSPPTGMSRLCLSCHDGSVALGDMLGEQVQFPTGHEFLQPGSGGIEPMLRDDHPVSIRYDQNLVIADPELKDPTELPTDLILENGDILQCATCHDVHDNSLGAFSRRPWENGVLCETCHVRDGWGISSHRLAIRPQASTPLTGCLACHTAHFGTLNTPLLVGTQEEDGCYACHDFDGPAINVGNDFSMPFHHPLESTSGVHAADEDPSTMARHVECNDCHNPHAVANTGDPMGALAQQPGLDRFGFEIDPAMEPQQVCYRCHGLTSPPIEAVPRQVSGLSIREQFSDNAVSSHPIEHDAIGWSPSLRPEWQSVPRITCMDCHGGPEGTASANRPHGSTYPFLLRAQYRTDTGLGFTNSDAALCARCHDFSILRSSQSSFDKHDKHMDEGILCVSCHSPHGVVGNPLNHQHMVNFDLRVVQPLPDGRLSYESNYVGSGKCSLTCHGEEHDEEDYK